MAVDPAVNSLAVPATVAVGRVIALALSPRVHGVAAPTLVVGVAGTHPVGVHHGYRVVPPVHVLV